MAQPGSTFDLKATILEILAGNRLMTIATLRPDGWPQATVVGYANDDLLLYFAIARTSQKLANIAEQPRVSIALGRDMDGRIRGLSMAAWAREVTDLAEIDRVNELLRTRYPEAAIFAPRSPAAAVINATPMLISVIDLAKAAGEPTLVKVATDLSVELAVAAPGQSAPTHPDAPA